MKGFGALSPIRSSSLPALASLTLIACASRRWRNSRRRAASESDDDEDEDEGEEDDGDNEDNEPPTVSPRTSRASSYASVLSELGHYPRLRSSLIAAATTRPTAGYEVSLRSRVMPTLRATNANPLPLESEPPPHFLHQFLPFGASNP
jgi:hypothetical protein